MRINKFLASSGLCSRRQADKLIKQGKVKINGRLAVLGDKVGNNDQVFVNGKLVKPKTQKIYLAYNKPVGIICTTDKNCSNNIIQAVNYPERIFPVGRLDVNSCGLIILTNDGEIVNKINKYENKIEKEYKVIVDKPITLEFIKKMQTGVKIKQGKTFPAKLKKIDQKSFYIILKQGWNRQIRQMCKVLGYNVVFLQRIRIGRLKLNDLPEGKYKKISLKQIL